MPASSPAASSNLAMSIQPCRKAISSRHAIGKRLPVLDGAHELAGLEQAVACAGVEPGEAAAEPLDGKLAALEISAVDVGDLQLAACRWL